MSSLLVPSELHTSLLCIRRAWIHRRVRFDHFGALLISILVFRLLRF